MRPESLFPLYAPVTSLPGVGPRIGLLLEKLVGPHVVDLLWHLPRGLIDRSFAPKVAEAPAGRMATLTLTVDAHLPSSSPRRPYRVRCSDETGFLHLVFFHARKDWLEKLLPVGSIRVVSGVVEHFNNEIQITHPDHVVPLEEKETVEGVEPVYGLTAGLAPKVVTKAVKAALDRAPELAEWQDPALKARHQWPDWKPALLAVHSPGSDAELSAMSLARQRLAYDEMLANQLALALVRNSLRRQSGRSIVGDGRLRARVAAALPWSLTGAQARALAEIDRDMAEPLRMLRLLQGDVGSGKTVVALMAMLAAVEAGHQAANSKR